ncbi:acyl-CoA dehydrogenase family protein [Nannocystis bainbridge]|uniref:Acyl-CoA dehydrogenase family protein n=1 Tax=Nannocystis bainbridge TaxID=2995303 RepID=A0ABT5DW45_9BACT|nr:acyl-CoA dehydrogenase family protein [Nannocystis bainbridge]MDC0717780.1 acyl-CoA dehydrogenase family protein [Nannocystis bainbridge]
MLHTPYVTERALGLLDAARWRPLEDALAVFVTDLRARPVDEEAGEDAAARVYLKRLATAGLLEWVVPAAWGGAELGEGEARASALSSTAICLIRQWLARESGALDTAFVMQGLGSFPLALAADESLRRYVLPRVASGATICAFALTEPEAGSDVKNLRTLATTVDGGVVLDGSKCFISNAGLADSYVVFAREAGEGKPRFSAFFVAGDAPGLSVIRTRVLAPHPIGTVKLERVFVPAAHRVGEPGAGLKLALGNLDVFRVSVGAAALGLADRALAETVAHLKRRVQFGKPLAEQQGLQFALADLATDQLAAQLLVYRAAGARDAGHATSDMAAMAKMHATESAQRAIDRAVQSFGGLGVTVGEVPERLYREIRALRIYEGATEVQKLVIARALLDERG